MARRSQLLLTAAAALLLAAFTGPPLLVFGSEHFTPGQWSVKPLDDGSRAMLRGSVSICISRADQLIYIGHDGGTDACTRTVSENSADRAVVVYGCKGTGSGRTTIVRDARNHFTVDAEGLNGAVPFAFRAEYMRTGACKG